MAVFVEAVALMEEEVMGVTSVYIVVEVARVVLKAVVEGAFEQPMTGGLATSKHLISVADHNAIQLEFHMI